MPQHAVEVRERLAGIREQEQGSASTIWGWEAGGLICAVCTATEQPLQSYFKDMYVYMYVCVDVYMFYIYVFSSVCL